MKTLFVLLFFLRVSSPVKHSLRFFIAAFSEVPNFPELMGSVIVDEIQACYCNTDTNTFEPKQDWMRKYLDDNPDHLKWYTGECFQFVPNRYKARIFSFKQRLNKSEGAQVLQKMSGCEWDSETGEVTGFNQFGYQGEDFLSLDLKTRTWVTPDQKAVIIKQRWDVDTERISRSEHFYTQLCPVYLKNYLNYGKSSLLRTELPSVSLLQKTPSSPITCHATGFYPDRAWLFWTKDGEELHEDVYQGAVLPNHDGTFQMSVDMPAPSDKPEDWGRYECVFQLSGVKEHLTTKLERAAIRTNREKPTDMTTIILAVMIILAIVFIAAAGFIIYKRKTVRQDIHVVSPTGFLAVSNSEVLEQPNPDEQTTNMST